MPYPIQPYDDNHKAARQTEKLIENLLEQGHSPQELPELLSLLANLKYWSTPPPTSTQTQQFVTGLEQRLAKEVKGEGKGKGKVQEKMGHFTSFSFSFFSFSSRQRTGEQLQPKKLSRPDHPTRLGLSFGQFIMLARAQLNLLGWHFWGLSGVIVGLGLLLLLTTGLARGFILQLTGPLLAYVGTAYIFRNVEQGLLELELACPPSLVQITLARLLVVLGYDSAIGLGLSLVAASPGVSSNFVALTLDWLAPLLLVTGLALLLSLRLVVTLAASLAYLVWLVGLLTLTVLINRSLLPDWHTTQFFTGWNEGLLAVVGVLLIVLAVLKLPVGWLRYFPHH